MSPQEGVAAEERVGVVSGPDPPGPDPARQAREAFAAKDQPVVNQIGQHYNHTHFWQWMKKDGGGKKLPGKLEPLVQAYGGYDKLRTDFVQAGVTQFGSGWAWLIMKSDGKLAVTKTPNGANPLSTGEGTPILGAATK